MAKRSKGVELQRIRVELTGASPIMFDRYVSKEAKLPVDRKMYLDDANRVVLPTDNLCSFLACKTTGASCASSFIDARKRDPFVKAVAAYVSFADEAVPFLREGAPVVFNGFNGSDVDQATGIYIDRDKALVGKSIPDDKERPVLPLPWALDFTLQLVVVSSNTLINADLLRDWFEVGGITVALGAHRPKFGRFTARLTEE